MQVDYSIVIPVYYNEGSLAMMAKKVHEKVFAVMDKLHGELLFVDDGSGDGSFAELEKIVRDYPHDVRVIKLSRNFGQVSAWWCGIKNTPGPVVVISADGQDPVELIPTMLHKYFDDGNEIVIATRQSREETAWRRITSAFVYSAIRKLSTKDLPSGGFDFFLLGTKAKASLIANWQPNTFFQIRIMQLGFNRVFIPYHRSNREVGISRWTFSKKITYMIDGVLGHSYMPIRAMSILGLAFSSISFLMAIFFAISYFFNQNVVRGWTPIVLLILFIGGIQMMMIGVLGEYLWRILAQTRQDTPYIIEKEIKCVLPNCGNDMTNSDS